MISAARFSLLNISYPIDEYGFAAMSYPSPQYKRNSPLSQKA
jgi:hypothetical protein